MRIAIVDDDPIVCQSLETILTATGTAGSARKVAHFGSWPSMER